MPSTILVRNLIDPDFEHVLFNLFHELLKDAVLQAESRPTRFRSRDQFHFTSKLLPYARRLFQERYRGGYLADETATWNVYYRTESGE